MTPSHAVLAAQPSSAEAAQQVAAEAGVSPDDVEILSVTYAGTQTRGNEIVEIWNIQYRIKSRASQQPSSFLPPVDQFQEGTPRAFSWPFNSTRQDDEETVPEAQEALNPLARQSDGDDGQQAGQTLFTGLAISVCVLVFVGLAILVACQIMRVRRLRVQGSLAGPPPMPRRNESIRDN